MQFKIMMLVILYMSILTGSSFAGDDHDIYHHVYRMCKAIVKNHYKAAPISAAHRRTAIQRCLGHSTRHF
jgi:hypothetical protein